MFENPVKVHVGGTNVIVNFTSIPKSIKMAETWLANQIVADSMKFIPFRKGGLRGSVIINNGSGGTYIEWNTPYAHYLYTGEVYVNPKTLKSGYIGSDGMWHGWRGAKIPGRRPLKYHTAGTGDHWVERAAEAYGKDWERGIALIISGG